MNKLIVTYDLCGRNKNYDGLLDRLENFPTHLKIIKSSWVSRTIYSCAKVRDELQKQIDSDDMLFVAKLTGEAAWTKTESNSSEIKKALESND